MTIGHSSVSSSRTDRLAVPLLVWLGLASGCGGAGAGGGAVASASAPEARGVARCADVAPQEAHRPPHPAPPRQDGKPSALQVLGLTPPDEKPWAQMNAEEREWYMVGKVLPVMKELFQAYDVQEFAEVKCETCHGEGMKDVEFAMPSRELLTLPRPGTDAYGRLCAQRPQMMVFMETKVTPAMGRLLGEEDYTCAGCHRIAP